MSLEINIRVPAEAVNDGSAPGYLERALSAIGFKREALTSASRDALAAYDQGVKDGMKLAADTPEAVTSELQFKIEPATADEAPAPAQGATATRQRGQPAPGKARRTKAEIAEDEAAAAEEAKVGGIDRSPNPNWHSSADPGRIEIISQTGLEVEEIPLISSGDERINPEDVADEKAEADAKKTGLTLDDLRNAVGAYGRVYGIPAAQADIRQLLGKPIVEVTDAELPKAIETVETANVQNPFERTPISAAAPAAAEPVKAAPEPPKALEKGDVMAAMLRYAKVFDGTDDPTKAKFAATDCGQVFKMLFGEEKSKFSAIPTDQESLAKAVAGIEEALAKNPFKRVAVA